MKNKRIAFLMIMVISMLILQTAYLIEHSRHLGEILGGTLVVIVLYIGFRQLYEEWFGNDGTFKDNFAMPNIKKRYIIIFSVYGFLINSVSSRIYTGIFGFPKNEQRLNEKQHMFEMDISNGIKAPIVEEILFRGLLFLTIVSLFYVLNGKSRGCIKILAMNITFVIVSTVIFGLMHGMNWGRLFAEGLIETDFRHTIPYLVAGLIYSLLYMVTKTLFAPIIAHMLNNLSASDFPILSFLDFQTTVFFALITTLVILAISVVNYMTKGNQASFFKEENTRH